MVSRPVEKTGQERLDEAKIETLRVWGDGLSADPRPEVRAAGRAITMLVEEIERLNVDLWNERARVPGPASIWRDDQPAVAGEGEAQPARDDLQTTLQRSLVPRFGG
jgi:hypothetical protein